MNRTSPLAALLLVALTACGAPAPDTANESAATAATLPGEWRGVLDSPGGELPFTLRINQAAGGLEAAVINGPEEVRFSSVTVDGSRVELRFDHYDSQLTATLGKTGDRMTGRWSKVVPEGASTLPFSAVRGDSRRFLPRSEAGLPPGGGDGASVAGVWSVEFVEPPSGDPEPARGEFAQDGSEVLGTFLTPTGDYRYLAGRFEDGLLRLSTFDGAHAFLFEARVGEDGELAGDFWSRDTYHATWTARRDPDAALPDAWQAVGLTNGEGRLSFSFPDLQGTPVSLSDERFEGRVVIVNIFGTWCPNCNDEAPVLAGWHRRYRDRGLEVVGLAYEFSGDPERDGLQLRRYAERHDIEYPLLLAGTSDKTAAGETLPDLTAVLAYPTSIFVGRDGTVRRIHSGFAGPGTGDHHDRLIAEQEQLLEELLAEAAG